MSADFHNKTVVITGAGQGLGKAFALGFADKGARVLLPDMNLENAEKTAQQINEAGGTAKAIEADISDEKQVKRIAETVLAEYKGVDILVNNAGNTAGVGATAWDAWTSEEWERMFSVNVKGTWQVCKAIAPAMVKQGRGKIINITSDIMKLPGADMGLAYACSKASVYTLTQTLARILGPSGIQVNGVAPGLTATESVLEHTPPQAFDATVSLQNVKRREIPEDLVGTVLFLASKEADFISGQIIFVNGGAVML